MKHLIEKCRADIFPYFMHKALSAALLLVAIISLPFCGPSKNASYFSNISDSQLTRLPDMKRPEPIIMTDDMLEIKIAGGNETTTQVFNTYGGISAGGAAGAPVYTVDGNGEIEFPYIGKVKVAGLTREELKNKLKADVSKYLKDVLVSVRFTNFRFTVLGEVRLPGSYLLPSDKVTILEALGQAGDMTQYARRNEVRVVRDSSGKREIGKIDFTQKEVFTSPFYYLRRNDVVYVEPDKKKSQSEQFSKASTIVTTLASLIAITITIFKR
jgi:polysaccharide export outer membrane protein